MSVTKPAKRNDSDLSPVLWRSILILLLFACAQTLWAVLAVNAFLAGDIITAVAMTAGGLAILWSMGSLYISVPLAIYFQKTYRSDRSFAEIERVHKFALKILMKLPLRRSLSLAVTMSNIGLLRLCQGDYEDAAAMFYQASKYIAGKRRLERSVTAVVIHHNLATALIRMNKYYEAEPIATKALELAESPKLKKQNPILAAAPMAALANMRLRLGELEGAINEYKAALELCDQSPPPPSATKAGWNQARLFTLLGLANATVRLGDEKESEKWLQQAWTIMNTYPELVNTLVLDHLNILANEYMDKKKFHLAEPLIELAYLIGQSNPYHPDSMQLLHYYEKLLLLTDRKTDISDMRSWVRHVEINALSSNQTAT